jgi:nitric oxide reductase NorQ protein
MDIITPGADQFKITDAPYYAESGSEIAIFEAAWKQKVPVLLKGPTGCGKTRFVSYMAHKLGLPLITVSCHEDLSASDLIGRYVIQNDEVLWSDGPMTAAVRMGAILYLDEVVEARKDTIVAIHPLSDHRRSLLIDKLATVIEAPDQFLLVISYNPGYQSLLKELKPSTRQRFASIAFDYPTETTERDILVTETGIDADIAGKLAALATRIRKLTHRGLEEGASTRLLLHTARLIQAGVPIESATNSTLVETLSDDPEMQNALRDLIDDFFG